jgi:hypothetical protein
MKMGKIPQKLIDEVRAIRGHDEAMHKKRNFRLTSPECCATCIFFKYYELVNGIKCGCSIESEIFYLNNPYTTICDSWRDKPGMSDI